MKQIRKGGSKGGQAGREEGRKEGKERKAGQKYAGDEGDPLIKSGNKTSNVTPPRMRKRRLWDAFRSIRPLEACRRTPQHD